MTMAMKRDLTMETPTSQSMERIGNMGMSVSVLVHHPVVKDTIGEAKTMVMRIPSMLT